MPAEFDLMLDVLENFPLAGTQRNPVKNKRVLHIFGSENKPATLQLTDQQMARRKICDLAEIRLRQPPFRPDDIAIFARIAGPLGANLQQGRIFRLASCAKPAGRSSAAAEPSRRDRRRLSRGSRWRGLSRMTGRGFFGYRGDGWGLSDSATAGGKGGGATVGVSDGVRTAAAAVNRSGGDLR